MNRSEATKLVEQLKRCGIHLCETRHMGAREVKEWIDDERAIGAIVAATEKPAGPP